ncbi:MAG TPA: BamA/TamA family outer membrane protein, partial [Pirellulales bacterium]|nr:BamA/TamA family outer membrane protein [Pirellulales bacterium]
IGRELEFNERQNWMTLTFVIDEGPRYKVENISIVGNSKFDNPTLEKVLKLKDGEFFDQHIMQQDLTALQDKYGAVGYIFAAVEPDLRFEEEPGKLDLVYQVQEGSRYRIGRVEVKISGDNPRTRRHTVLNRISVRPGQIADIRELRDSERRLKGSGLFTNKPAEGIEPRLVWGQPGVDADDGSNEGGSDSANKPQRGGGGGGGGGRMGRGGGGGGMRGQSPDDVNVNSTDVDDLDADDEWRPEPGCTDKPINVVILGNWIDEVEAKLPWMFWHQPAPAPTVVRAQSPTYAPVDDIPRYPSQQPTAPVYPQNGWPAAPTNQPAAMPAAQPVAVPNAPPYAVGQVPMGRTNPDISPSGAVPAGGGYQGTGQVIPAQYAQPQYIPPTPRPGDQQYLPPQPGYAPPTYVPPGQLPAGAPAYGPPQPVPSPTTGYDSPQQLVPGSGPPPGGLPPGALPPGAFPQGLPPAGAGPNDPGSVAPAPFTFSDEEPTIEIPVVAQVQEAQTGRLMLGVGVNSSSGLVGQVTISEQNFDWRRFPTSWEDIRTGTAFRGGGQKMNISAMPGTQYSQYSTTFVEPYFLDTLVSFSLSGQYFNRFFQDWTEQRIGGRAGFGYQFTPDMQGQFNLRAENVNIYDPTVPTPQPLAMALGNNDLFTAKFDLIHDTRDSPFLPSQGHYVDLGFEQAFGQFYYSKGTIDARKYFLLRQRPDRSGRHTLTLMNSTGWTGTDTPIFENFFAGGYQTIRGFYFRGASPLINGVQVGGIFQFLNTVEYMYPITADDMLRGVVFCDYGTVERSYNLVWDDFRVAPGFGLRITIPAMGPAPIALDFAFPVHQAAGDRIQNFAFFVGAMR